jgi:hypothetical protein
MERWLTTRSHRPNFFIWLGYSKYKFEYPNCRVAVRRVGQNALLAYLGARLAICIVGAYTLDEES